MNLQKDLREFVELLSALDVHFLVVGAFAVAYHGYPRYTADIDLFIERSPQKEIGGLHIPFISRDLLKRNKAASGRTQDLADLEHL